MSHCHPTKMAFDEIIPKLNFPNKKSYKYSNLTMQSLRDNTIDATQCINRKAERVMHLALSTFFPSRILFTNLHSFLPGFPIVRNQLHIFFPTVALGGLHSLFYGVMVFLVCSLCHRKVLTAFVSNKHE